MAKTNRLQPRGLSEAKNAAAKLSDGTYAPAPEAEPETAAAPTPPASVVAVAKPASTSAKPRRGRSDAEGMTRRTFYLQTVDADDLEQAITQTHEKLNGLVPKHRILKTILSMGLNNLDDVTQRLKDELRAGLD